MAKTKSVITEFTDRAGIVRTEAWHYVFPEDVAEIKVEMESRFGGPDDSVCHRVYSPT